MRFVASYTTYDRAVKVAYDAIRHYGASVPVIAEHLVHTLGEIASRIPESRLEPIIAQARAVLHGARESIENPRDRAAIDEAERRFAEKAGLQA